VWTRWTPDALRKALADADPLFYILTNSRSLSEPDAIALNSEIASNLVAAARQIGCDLDVVSRSDSTLRGHFPAEIQALQSTLEPGLGCHYDGIVVCPFFLEGGRLTAGDIHWVTEGERVIPAAQTEYARDATFGYEHSNLRRWVEEKTGGRVPASEVVSVSLDAIRRKGPARVRQALRQVTDGRVAVVNAVSYRDMALFVDGLLDAEAKGQRFLFRTAASFVKVRGGVSEREMLTAAEMVDREGGGGLIVVGSYVQKTTRQLRRALELPALDALELEVRRVLNPATRSAEIERVTQGASKTIAEGRDALVYTSRDLVTDRGRAGELDTGQQVSSALVEVVRRVTAVPHFIIAKGGVTSSDVATHGLDVQRAWVLGQILPGIPVWRLGEESRFPTLPYVVFPGNVGTDESLSTAIQILRD
jgi:uncharacterized protein YgbK (DUF1537 family)